MDLNGDGLPDLVYGYGYTGQQGILMNTGSDFVPAASYFGSGTSLASVASVYLQSNNGAQGVDFLDISGTGIPSMIQLNMTANIQNLYTNSIVAPDQLTAINNTYGPSYTISYAPLTNKAIYTPTTGDSISTSGQFDLTPPMFVTTSVGTSNGVGGTNNSFYQYGGLKFDANRGLVGFSWSESLDQASQHKSRTDFNQTFPYIGQVNHQQGSWCPAPATGASMFSTTCTLLSDTTNQWASKYNFGSTTMPESQNVLFPFIQNITTTKYEIPAGLGH